MEHYEEKALLYAEKHGLIDYQVNNNVMIWIERYPSEGTFKHILNLNTMKEKVVSK